MGRYMDFPCTYAGAPTRQTNNTSTMAEVSDEAVMTAMIEIATAHRRLWPPQTKWPQKGPRPPDETEVQTLFLLSQDPEIGRDEVADFIAVDPSTVAHAVQSLRARGLVRYAGRNPIDRRRWLTPLTAEGWTLVLAMVERGRPAVEHIADRRGGTDEKWPWTIG